MRIIQYFAGMLLIVFCANAQASFIDFDDVVSPWVNDHYAAEGIFFETDIWYPFFLAASSRPNSGVLGAEAGYVDILGGFEGALSFHYGAFVPTTLTLYDGLGATGSTLLSAILPSNDGIFFEFINVPFAGTARSVLFETPGSTANFGWDDVMFGGVPVPAPPTLVTLLIGLFLLRYRIRCGASAHV